MGFTMKLSETTGYTICRIARKIHYQVDEIFKPYGITVEQWSALKYIDEEAPLSQKDLSLLLEKNQNTVKSLVSHLEEKGLICRKADATDKRNKILQLTTKGNMVIQKLSFLDETVNLDFLQTFTEEEKETLHHLLLKIEKSITHHT